MTPRSRPVRRASILFAALVGVLLVWGLVALGEWLRHPHPGHVDLPELADGDLRDPLVCPDHPAAVEPGANVLRAPLAPELVNANMLYDCPDFYDGRRVRYQGEVVGAVLRRRHGAWAQLNDDVYARTLGPLPAHRGHRGGNAGTGVLLPHDVADQIGLVGGPRTRGDLVEVVGVFHRVDRRTREVAVIRAETGQIVEAGEWHEEPIQPQRIVVALLLGVAAAVLAAADLARSRGR